MDLAALATALGEERGGVSRRPHRRRCRFLRRRPVHLFCAQALAVVSRGKGEGDEGGVPASTRSVAPPVGAVALGCSARCARHSLRGGENWT